MTAGGRPPRRARRASPREIASASVRVAGLGVVVDGRALLDGVDLEAHPGEIVALLGPNGAGKSTLLACLSGDRAPSSGSIELAGRPLADWTVGDRAHRRAVVTQEAQVAFPFTVAEVVAMGRAPWAGTVEQDRDAEVIDAVLDESDTASFRDRPFPGLSGGERARSSFARALAQRTPVLLLDEPTAALDLGHQEELLATVRRLADDGATVVVVLHDLSLASAWADRVVLLADGRVVSSGPPDEVVTAEVVSRVYGHPVRVLRDPATGTPLVVPDRRIRASSALPPRG